MKIFYVNKGKKFIYVKLKNICNKKDITIKYSAFCIYNKNRLAKQGL